MINSTKKKKFDAKLNSTKTLLHEIKFKHL